MEYLVMDRASEAAANDLAEVRKLIEGMNALVNSQLQQQQQQQQYQLPHSEYPTTPQQQDATSLMATIASAATQQNNPYANITPTPNKVTPPKELHSPTQNSVDTKEPVTPETPTVNTKGAELKIKNENTQQTDNSVCSNPAPQTGVIIEVIHLTFNRVLYFQLTQDATIEPMVAWLRLSFGDAAISGMVLQYKGFDGLWKCLLNRDDSLRRILKQNMKGNTMLQMRVPREQDLLSSGYTDRRLLALTKSELIQ